ncbi:FapA family protein, partial [Calditrichota bacterium]
AILLAEIKKGYIGEKELKFQLNAAGYSFGLIEQSIAALEQGYKGQILLATALMQYETAGIWSHTGININRKILIDDLNTENFNFSKISFQVKKDERLLTITTTPKIILRYPDGRKLQLKELSIESVAKLCGANTHLDVQSKSIYSKVSGSLHSSIYGVLSVYPEKIYRSIGKSYEKIKEKFAINVEQDITPESYIDIPSNLVVDGFIKSSIIEVGGNVVCHYGIDNSQELDTVSVTAGQSIFTSTIKKYPVWSGSSILVRKSIEDSSVQCLDTVAVPLISSSEIRVGNKLFVKDIIQKSKIYLGTNFVENEELNSRRSYHKQHEKKLIDLENMIIAEQLELELNRRKVVTQIKKLRKYSKSSFSSDIVLNRFLTALTEGVKKTEKKIEDYEMTLNLFEKEGRELSFFEQQLHHDSQPEIIAFGKITRGCVINAENQVYKVIEELENVSIKLDTLRGILNIQKNR